MSQHKSEDGLPERERRLAGFALLSAISLVVIDSSIVNVALPTIAYEFEISPTSSTSIVTSYQIALVIALLPFAALGESVGFRRIFSFGVIAFTISSCLCIVAPSLPWLVFARFVQGVGGAAIMAVMAGLLRFTYPGTLLATALGWNAMAVALSSAAGPALGSLILSFLSWHWLFVANIPIGFLVYWISRILPQGTSVKRKLDAISVTLNAFFFAPLVFGLSFLVTRPVLALFLIVIGLMSLFLLIRREIEIETPLFPIDLLRKRPISLSVIASLCCFSAQTGSYIALPFYLQSTLSIDLFMVGLLMTPWPLSVALAAPLAAKMSHSVSTAKLCFFGCIIFSLGLLCAGLWPLKNNPWPLIAFNIIAGAGFGLFQTPNNRNMLLSSPRERAGAAGGMQATTRLLGQACGAVGMGLLFGILPFDDAPRVGLILAAGLALAGGLVSALRASSQ